MVYGPCLFPWVVLKTQRTSAGIKFMQIKEAHDVLMDVKARAALDDVIRWVAIISSAFCELAASHHVSLVRSLTFSALQCLITRMLFSEHLCH